MFPVSNLFLILTQFYVPSECYHNPATTSCITAGKHHLNFTIHGLWPEFYNNSYPSYCNHSAIFNETVLQPYTNLLNTYWLSYMGNNSDFWRHEYLKHATCDPNVNETQFFNTTLNLYQQLNTTNLMHLNNITYDRPHSKTKMEKIFNGVFNCYLMNNGEGMFVNQFWSCFDIHLNRITCPVWLNQKSCSGNTITFQSLP